jgi:hypothetical protein
MCARVKGRLLQFQVWVKGTDRPRWDDPAHGASVGLPGGTGYQGLAGWYVGHLAAADRAIFRDPVAGPPTSRPR